MSKIKGWKIIEDRPKNIIIYYNEKSLSKVKVRSTYGRYILFEFVKRWLQEAIAGTSDTTQTIGSSFTNAYGQRSRVQYARNYNPSQGRRFRDYTDAQGNYHDID